MKKLILFLFIGFYAVGYSQKTLSTLLKQHNTGHIPYMTVEMLSKKNDNIAILDAREQNEYNVSHLKNAIFVGYNHFNLAKTSQQLTNKQQPIVVYCSLGVRSEDIADKLKKAGYTAVFNLYGGIFEWKNKGFSVVDLQNKETQKVHAYSKNWGKWLLKGEKIYD